jgi:hypothetical protein
MSRPKGSKNKGNSKTARDNLIACFDQTGGLTAYVSWAKANPDDFYKLYTQKLVPSEQISTVSGKVDIKHAGQVAILDQALEAVERARRLKK